MTTEVTKKFIDAVKSAGIETYQFDTDLGTHLYNNTENAVAIFDESTDSVFSLRKKFTHDGFPYEGNIIVTVADISDIHEVKTGGTFEQVKKFIDVYGVTLDDDQLNILLKIDRNNRVLKPLTGDYNFHFVEKTEEEIAAMSEEEKLKYDEALAKFKEAKRKNQSPVSVII